MNLMRAYLPMQCDPSAVENLFLAHGGYTITEAYGAWNDRTGNVVRERVQVWECCTDAEFPYQQMQHAGRMFLLNNRAEKEFLGMIIADRGVTKISIQQEKK